MGQSQLVLSARKCADASRDDSSNRKRILTVSEAADWACYHLRQALAATLPIQEEEEEQRQAAYFARVMAEAALQKRLRQRWLLEMASSPAGARLRPSLLAK